MVKFPIWAVEFLGQRYPQDSGIIDTITLRQSAKAKNSTVSIQLSSLGKPIVEKLIAKSKSEGGIKLPKSLLDEDKENQNTLASSANSGYLPGLETHINRAEVSAFLDTIAFCEGTHPDGYNIIVGYEKFTDFRDHPRKLVPEADSDAAGRYQFLSTTWDGIKDSVNAKDFSPENQNKAGWALAKRDGGITEARLLTDVQGCITACNRIWASLPGAPYNQPTRSMVVALERYHFFLNKYKSNTTPIKQANSTAQQQPKAPDSEKTGWEKSRDFPVDLSQLDCNTKAYLHAVAWTLGTASQGANAYNINVSNPTTLVDGSKPIGKYKITGSVWNKLSNKTLFDQKGQDTVFIRLINHVGAYDRLIQGDINGVNRSLKEFYPELPQGGGDDLRTRPEFEVEWDKAKTNCVAGEKIKIDGQGKIESVETGEQIKVTITTNTAAYTYHFFFTNLDDFTIMGKSPESSLAIQEKSDRFSDLSELELATVLLKRNGFNLDISRVIKDNLETRNYVMTKQTDQTTLEDIYQRTGITFNPISIKDFEASGTDVLPLRRLIITDYFETSFSIEAIDPTKSEKPDYPVTISLLTTNSVLDLKPKTKVSLLSPYNIIPDALKFDEWLIQDIEHDMRGKKTKLSLTKVLRLKDDEEDKKETNKSTFGGAKDTSGSKSAAPNKEDWAFPVDNPIVTSRFDPARVNPVSGRVRPHKGTDLVSGSGDSTAPIKAALSGKVTRVSFDSGGYGNYVIIQHTNDIDKLETLYAHMSFVNVRVDESVTQGQNIGLMGSTGGSTGAHLHFEVIQNDIAVNPEVYYTFTKIN